MNAPSNPPEYKLVVSIINYRTADLTWACIQSVLADLGGRQDVLIAVVDNLSGDGSVEALEVRIAGLDAGHSPVRLIRSASNSGFSGGHNQGIAAARAAYYLVLNSDAKLRPGFIAAMLSAAGDARDEVGLWAPRIEYDDGEQQINLFRFPTPASEIIRGANTGPVTKVLRRWDVPLAMPPAPEHIGWASFACILLRGRMVHELGPMDEGYFLYFEDAEYCLRARRAGWRIAYQPEARVVHYRGGSGPVKSLDSARKRLPAYFYASRSRFMRQVAGVAGPVAANLGWLLGRGIAQMRRLTGRDVPQANAHEARDIWINCLRPLSGGSRQEG